jgi:AcrR family transcriptional regulator
MPGKPPRKKDHALRREDLAKAAFRVIARDGITGATARKVAQEAGCLPGLLTHYIRTMDELLLVAAEHAVAEITKEWIPIDEKYRGERALHEAISMLLPLDRKRTDRWKIWISFWDLSRKSPAIKKVLDGFRKEMTRSYTRLIITAQRNGDLPRRIDPVFAAHDLLFLITGLAVAKVTGVPPISPREQLQHVDRWLAILVRPK